MHILSYLYAISYKLPYMFPILINIFFIFFHIFMCVLVETLAHQMVLHHGLVSLIYITIKIYGATTT